MSLEGHLIELTRRHKAIEHEIKNHLSKPFTNSEQIANLKRKKLFIKDEIARLQSNKAKL